VERRLGKRLEANRMLAWYPKALLGSGIMEALVAHDEVEVPKRLLKLIRIYVSFLASCPFCIDMNAKQYRESGLSDEEILFLRGIKTFEEVGSVSETERAALEYARCATSTPVAFTTEVMDRLRSHYSDRAIVIIASTIAQVNFWTRLIQSLGVQPAGFSSECSILELEKYRTMRRPG
jgi:AhpD family alkylhydroperoxidase